MVNYQQGKIYKITSLQTDKIYIGSTCKKTLAERMAQHRNTFKKWKQEKYHYVSIFELLDKYNDCVIVLIEKFSCNDKDELEARERYYIELNKDICVNKNIPTRTQKEYYENNKDNILEYQKHYYENNKDKIKEYREKNTEKIKNFKKEYDKKYREQNKDKIKQQQKEYREKNLTCDCGSDIRLSHKSKHLKTKKHLEYINSLNQ